MIKNISTGLLVAAISMLSIEFAAEASNIDLNIWYAIVDVMVVMGGIGAIVTMHKGE